jgi:hypothetical protein
MRPASAKAYRARMLGLRRLTSAPWLFELDQADHQEIDTACRMPSLTGDGEGSTHDRAIVFAPNALHVRSRNDPCIIVSTDNSPA